MSFRLFGSYILRKLLEIKSFLISCFYPTILIHGYFFRKRLSLYNYNLGDDISVPLIEALTGRKVLFRNWTYNGAKKEHLLTIGSLVDYYTNENSVIWGSGAIEASKPMSVKPRHVCSVRGPLTREYLLKNGIDCPEIYGDPALLVPLIYNLQVEKKYRVGVIPHIVDYDKPVVRQLMEDYPDFHFIRFGGYKSWKGVINEIRSCDCIISSSLHGLILSDAYGIPNVHVNFSDDLMGGEFKFKDYYGGVKRSYIPPLDWRSNIVIEDAMNAIGNYEHFYFDPKQLLNAFPYKLSKRFLSSIKDKNV